MKDKLIILITLILLMGFTSFVNAQSDLIIKSVEGTFNEDDIELKIIISNIGDTAALTNHDQISISLDINNKPQGFIGVNAINGKILDAGEERVVMFGFDEELLITTPNGNEFELNIDSDTNSPNGIIDESNENNNKYSDSLNIVIPEQGEMKRINGEGIVLCSGCKDGSECYSIGFINRNSEYCSLDKRFIKQSNQGLGCEENYVCKSNLCVDNQCKKLSIWKKFIKWLRDIF